MEEAKIEMQISFIKRSEIDGYKSYEEELCSLSLMRFKCEAMIGSAQSRATLCTQQYQRRTNVQNEVGVITIEASKIYTW